MTTQTTPKSPLDGLLRCEDCKCPMVFDERNPTRQPVYTCNPRTHNGKPHCPAPELKACDLDNFVISQVMDTVLTKENTATLEAFTQELTTNNPKEENEVITRAGRNHQPPAFRESPGRRKRDQRGPWHIHCPDNGRLRNAHRPLLSTTPFR